MKKLFFLFLVLISWPMGGDAQTAQDDYQAGLKFYSSQNYVQALPYFDVTLRMEPNNLAALIARANCYYSLRRYPLALADYQKARALQPQNTQVAQFVQTLQARMDNDEEAPAPPLPPLPAGDHRMERQFGLVLGLISDPFISEFGFSADYNVAHSLRLTGSLGFLYIPNSAQATYVNGTETSSGGATLAGTSFGFGVKALVPGWEFSPVIGLNLAQTSLYIPPIFGTTGSSYNLLLIYANAGFDYQAKDGFDFGFGFDEALNISLIPIPGLNIGKFF